MVPESLRRDLEEARDRTVRYLARGGWVEDTESGEMIPLDAQTSLRMAQALETMIRAVPGILSIPHRVAMAERTAARMAVSVESPAESGLRDRLEDTYAEAMAAGAYGPAAALLRQVAEMDGLGGDDGIVEVRLTPQDEPDDASGSG